jgi:hypothetical protein
MSAPSNRPYRARSPPADAMFSEGASLFTQLPQTQTERSEARARATTNTTWSGDHQCRLTSTPSTQSFLSTSLLDGLAAGLNPGMLQLMPNVAQGSSQISIRDAAFTVGFFTGAGDGEQTAEEWLEALRKYIAFKKISTDDALHLFQMLLKGPAAIWLRSVPHRSLASFVTLCQAFTERYALTRIEKWRQTSEIWKRRQGPQESTDDYIATMQLMAKRIDMPQASLIDAILQGLRSEIRLMVLLADTSSIHNILTTARAAEAAHAADSKPVNNDDLRYNEGLITVNSKLDALLQQLSTTKSTTTENLERRVTFAQAAMSDVADGRDNSGQRRSMDRRSLSPTSGRSFGRRQSVSPGRDDMRDVDQSVYNIRHQAVTDLHTNRSRRGDNSDHQLAVQLQRDDRAIIYNNNNNNNYQVGKADVTIAVASINLDDNSVRLLTANVITAQKLVTSRECAVVDLCHRT